MKCLLTFAFADALAVYVAIAAFLYYAITAAGLAYSW